MTIKSIFTFLLFSSISLSLIGQVQEPTETAYTNTRNNALIYGGDMQYALGGIGGEQHWGVELRIGYALMDELLLSTSYRYQRLFDLGFSSLGTEVRYYISKLEVRPFVKAGINYVFAVGSTDESELLFNYLEINGQFELGGGLSFIPKNSSLGVDLAYHYFLPQRFFSTFDNPLPDDHTGIVATAFLLLN